MESTKLQTKSGGQVEVFFSSSPNPVALYEYTDSALPGKVNKTKNEAKPWYFWGTNNLFPQEIFSHVYKNDIKPELIKQSIDLICGKKVFTYKEVLDPNTGKESIKIVHDTEIEAFFKENRINTFFRQHIHNLELFGNSFTEMLRDGNGKIRWIKILSAGDCRAEYIDGTYGRIMNYYRCGDWCNAKYTEGDEANSTVKKLPAFFRYDEEEHDICIHHSKYYLPGQDYYSFPIWYFGTKSWAELSSEIPTYQLANIRNGKTIRFHIKIPAKYFDRYPAQEEKDKKKAELQDHFDKMLSGAENASKTFFSIIESINGNDVQGWDIVPINFDSKDETFLRTFDVSSRANSRGHGIHPLLTGLDIQGNLGSGSEILNLYNYHVSVKVVGQRDAALEVLNDIAEANGWDPDIKFGVQYVELTKTDANPTGKQNVA